MYRTNLTNEGTVKEFENNNINIKLSDSIIKDINAGHVSSIEALSWLLDSLDISFIGEEFCLSNYDMGATLYNCHSDRMYIIAFSDIDNVLMGGKSLKLFARVPDNDDREILEREFCGAWYDR